MAIVGTSGGERRLGVLALSLRRMARKSISELYTGSHASVARRQNERYGNPLTDAPDHVPAVIERALSQRRITESQARKLAIELGRISYGEWGLTSGRVEGAIDRVLGHGGGAFPTWHDRMAFSAALAN